jgi:asparagine N-glycosylation enzyme membrane subunit Stt3
MFLVIVAFATALAFRLSNAATWQLSPVDELYHLKRMTHFVDYDPDRHAFCPWPPLYDRLLGGIAHMTGATTQAEVLARVKWIPPIGSALFVALVVLWMDRRFGRAAAIAAGAALAASPFVVTQSWVGSIDHHWTEPIFVVGMIACLLDRRPLLLALALTAAMFVQTALLIAAALVFVILFFTTDGRAGAISFGIGAMAIALYRITRPPGYPDNAWFLGWTHAALFGAAAVACAYRAFSPLAGRRWRAAPDEGRMLPNFRPSPAASRHPLPAKRGEGSLVFALLAGACVVLATPTAPAALLEGSHFFGGEPWLRTINEFQPLWRGSAEDIVSIVVGLGVGAVLVWSLVRRDRVVAPFAILYLLLAISSRRFWSVGVPLLAIAGAIAAASFARRWLRQLALAAVAIVPVVQFVLWMLYPSPPPSVAYDPWFRAAGFLQMQPRDGVLAPWSVGHLLDIMAGRPVVIDNFGTMPDRVAFERAHDAFLTTHEETLARYCDERGVRFVAYDPPRGGMLSAAAILGLDAERLPKSTVWQRAYAGAPLRLFRRVYAQRGIVIVERQ